MDISELADQILETLYNSPVLSDNPYTQERIVRSEIYSLLEDWEKESTRSARSEALAEVKEEMKILKRKLAARDDA